MRGPAIGSAVPVAGENAVVTAAEVAAFSAEPAAFLVRRKDHNRDARPKYRCIERPCDFARAKPANGLISVPGTDQNSWASVLLPRDENAVIAH